MGLRGKARLLTHILKPALKGLAKRGHKKTAKAIYKYRRPATLTASLFSTPEGNDQENFNKYYKRLQQEGLMKDKEGLNRDGILDADDVLEFWNANSYHNKNRGLSWAQSAIEEGSAFIPYAGIPMTFGLGYAFSKNAESEDDKVYQEIRRLAYKRKGLEAPEFIPDDDAEDSEEKPA
jgi:hypothetical protein